MTHPAPPDGYYWALVFKEQRKVTVVQKSGEEIWLIGADFSIDLKDATLLQRIEPPPGYIEED
ncbi:MULTISPECIES: hypothetical protein [unclassified Bradyrhizobium]|uniref:hypothetical protein n=1 Tax=unclassified Bradyrhizobium TaxID=2631580 RepID=UPI002FF1EBF9